MENVEGPEEIFLLNICDIIMVLRINQICLWENYWQTGKKQEPWKLALSYLNWQVAFGFYYKVCPI